MLALLWILSALVIIALSIWPFDFHAQMVTQVRVDAFLNSWGWDTNRGDIVGNVLLFVPFAWLGLLTLRRQSWWLRYAVVAVSGLALAVLCQVLQLALPTRFPTLVDVNWNAVGLVAGLVLATPSWLPVPEPGTGTTRRSITAVPWLLVACWGAFRLAPFVPAVDWQLIKNNLKPLLALEDLKAESLLVNLAAWLTIGWLLRQSDSRRRLDLWVPALLAAVLLGETLIAGRGGLSPNHTLGGLLGVTLWLLAVRWLERVQTPLVLLALLAAIIWENLAPFDFAGEAVQPFHWTPFRGILAGNRLLNAATLCRKGFLYGGLVYLGGTLTRSWLLGGLLAASLLTALEFAQCFQPSHFPEVTDPLLAAGFAALLSALQAGQADPGSAAARPPQPAQRNRPRQ